MPVILKKRNTKKRATKKTNSLARFKKLHIRRPDVLHGYLRHTEINFYLEYLQNRYNFVQVLLLGLTHERRAIKAIEIDWFSERNMTKIEHERERRLSYNYNNNNISSSSNKNNNNNNNKSNKQTTCGNVKMPPPPPSLSPEAPQNSTAPAVRNIIFIEGGTHAREWMSIAVALNCIYQLTEKHVRNYDLLRKLRFIIIPCTNPDGYEYTMTKNRRWRKNRRPISPTAHHIGTDCNRNYDFHWNDPVDAPTKRSLRSKTTNRNTFRGSKAFSEAETCAIRNCLMKYKTNLLFFLSLHSYAESIMYPWGYCQQLPDAWQTLQKLALAGRNAVKSYNGRNYRVGSIANLSKRLITGSVVDYAYGVINVPLALVMELPSHELGFQPPAEYINPIGHESWFGIREMCKTAYDLLPRFKSGQETVILTHADEGDNKDDNDKAQQRTPSLAANEVI